MVRYFDGQRHVVAFSYKGRAQDCCGKTAAEAMRLHDRIVSGAVAWGNDRDGLRLHSVSAARIVK